MQLYSKYSKARTSICSNRFHFITVPTDSIATSVQQKSIVCYLRYYGNNSKRPRRTRTIISHNILGRVMTITKNVCIKSRNNMSFTIKLRYRKIKSPCFVIFFSFEDYQLHWILISLLFWSDKLELEFRKSVIQKRSGNWVGEVRQSSF